MTHLTLSWRRRMLVPVLLCIGLVAFSDWLFYQQPVGWTLALFAGALTAAMLVRGGHALRTVPGRVIAIALVGLIGALIYQPDAVNITLTLMTLVSLAIIDRVGWTSDVWAWVHRFVQFMLRGCAQWLRDSRLYHRYQQARSETSPRWLRLLVTWSLPIVLSAVFVGLFTLANPIIAQWFSDAGDWLRRTAERFPDLVAPARIALWLGIAIWVWALLRVRPGRRPERWRATVVTQANGASARLDRVRSPQMIVRCLVLFNVVFAVQNVLDGRYLWGGKLAALFGSTNLWDTTLPEGMTYATYAQRGAYPLVATALLAAVFVLITFTSRQNREQMRTARKLVVVWIAQNVVLMLGAAWRLAMYVDAYSLTRLRIAAAIWMGLVALGLLWIVLRIIMQRDNAWLLRVNVLTAAMVIYFCAFCNFDGTIANYNAAHTREVGGRGVAVDLDYMKSLGPEAIPALHRLVSNVDDAERAREFRRAAQSLERDLRGQTRNWRGWTVRRYALAEKWLAERQRLALAE